MIRASPCEYYIKYLLLHPEEYSNKAIIELLTKEELDPLGDYYVEELRTQLTPPSPFYPFDVKHAASRRFLRKQGVYRLFHRDADTERAFVILRSPRAKKYVEAALMPDIDPEAIARAVGKYGVPYCTAQTIRVYRHYFWNLDLLDSTQLEAVLAMRPSACLRSEDRDARAQADFLRRAWYRDVRHTLARLPRHKYSGELAKVQLGISSRNLNEVELLAELKQLSLLRVFEHLTAGGPDVAEQVQKMMAAVESIDRTRDRSVDPLAAVRDQMAKIHIRNEKGSVPTIDSLSGGNHSTDLMLSPGEQILKGSKT